MRRLMEDGFVMVPGPMAAGGLASLLAAYDAAMNSGEAEVRVGSTTTRLSDFVNRGGEFDALYTFGPLLDACRIVIGAPFKLSSSLGRTLRAGAGVQDLHTDIGRDSEDLPMVGFIFMVDEFCADNGATRFVPGSHLWPQAPDDVMGDRKAAHPDEALVCGVAGSLVIFNASIWHGHTGNSTAEPRRSVQGYFVRRDARSGTDWAAVMRPETLARIRPEMRDLLAL